MLAKLPFYSQQRLRLQVRQRPHSNSFSRACVGAYASSRPFSRTLHNNNEDEEGGGVPWFLLGVKAAKATAYYNRKRIKSAFAAITEVTAHTPTAEGSAKELHRNETVDDFDDIDDVIAPWRSLLMGYAQYAPSGRRRVDKIMPYLEFVLREGDSRTRAVLRYSYNRLQRIADACGVNDWTAQVIFKFMVKLSADVLVPAKGKIEQSREYSEEIVQDRGDLGEEKQETVDEAQGEQEEDIGGSRGHQAHGKHAEGERGHTGRDL